MQTLGTMDSGEYGLIPLPSPLSRQDVMKPCYSLSLLILDMAPVWLCPSVMMFPANHDKPAQEIGSQFMTLCIPSPIFSILCQKPDRLHEILFVPKSKLLGCVMFFCTHFVGNEEMYDKHFYNKHFKSHILSLFTDLEGAE